MVFGSKPASQPASRDYLLLVYPVLLVAAWAPLISASSYNQVSVREDTHKKSWTTRREGGRTPKTTKKNVQIKYETLKSRGGGGGFLELSGLTTNFFFIFSVSTKSFIIEVILGVTKKCGTFSRVLHYWF